MINKNYTLSLTAQCDLLSVARSRLYYQAKDETPFNQQLMHLIDRQYLKTPFYGSRQMVNYLRRQGYCVSRKRIRRLMKVMGLQAIYCQPKTSTANSEHRIYPYLLRNLPITAANHVWSTDITYIPMQSGHLYLVAIMDWVSRKVLSWRLSTTLDSGFCIEALEQALEQFAKPEIFNSRQVCYWA